MNYIEKFLKEHDLQQGEVFLLDGNDAYIDGDYDLFFVGQDTNNNDWYKTVLMGNKRIEKIKPKTLMEQLKERGTFYAIDWDGHISYLDISTEVKKDSHYIQRYDKQIKQGNIFLTKSDAEREAYRRKLEFEMQEWAREHDCLATTEDIGIGVEFDCFNVIVTHNMSDKLRVEFADKVDKYYNLEEWK